MEKPSDTQIPSLSISRIAFYGGSFDPIHDGHLAIGRELTRLFALEEFVFIPAFHAPHKKDKVVSPAYHRYSMIALATSDEPKLRISAIEMEAPERPFTTETQGRIRAQFPAAAIFFVIGADSWQEIDTWKNWESVLTTTNIIVVTRPGVDITFSHVTDKIRERITDLRGKIEQNDTLPLLLSNGPDPKIYFTDAVCIDISATEIRAKAPGWQQSVPEEVRKYIEKYKLY